MERAIAAGVQRIVYVAHRPTGGAHVSFDCAKSPKVSSKGKPAGIHADTLFKMRERPRETASDRGNERLEPDREPEMRAV